MGACLSSLCGTKDVDSSRDYSRRKSRGNSMHGSSIHKPPPRDFGVNSLFRVMELLGEGGTGQTYLCQDLRSARRVAIKFMPRPLAKVLVPMVSQEIQLQAQLSEGHIGLVRVESALLSRTHLGLVMEYVDGGTLTQYVMKRAHNRGERGGLHLTEDEARYFFRQLISAVEYLHKSHVAHRDLKMCNVVLTQRRPPTLKLCDFGFAKGWDESSFMHTRIGTPVYMSPQMIQSNSDGKAYSATAADVWACGVMLFAMMLGRFPYDHCDHPDPNSSGAHQEVWNEQMKNGDWATSPRVAPHIGLLSDECKDLLGKMLCTEEKQRITIPEIRKHPWFMQILPPYLSEALQEFEQRQDRLAKVMEGAHEEQVKRRNRAVHDLIVMAGSLPSDIIGGKLPKPGGASPITAIFEGVEGTAPSGTSSAPTPPRAAATAPGAGDPGSNPVSLPEADKSTRGGGGGAAARGVAKAQEVMVAILDKSIRGGRKGLEGGASGGAVVTAADLDKSVRGGTKNREPGGLQRTATDLEKSVRRGRQFYEGGDGDKSVRGGGAGAGAAASGAEAQEPASTAAGAAAAAAAPQAAAAALPAIKEKAQQHQQHQQHHQQQDEEPWALHQEQDVIMIELAAVAKRTKSDGLVLMSTYVHHQESTAEAESSRNCGSEDTDPLPDCRSSGDGSQPNALTRLVVESPPPPPPSAPAVTIIVAPAQQPAVAAEAAATGAAAAAANGEIRGSVVDAAGATAASAAAPREGSSFGYIDTPFAALSGKAPGAEEKGAGAEAAAAADGVQQEATAAAAAAICAACEQDLDASKGDGQQEVSGSAAGAAASTTAAVASKACQESSGAEEAGVGPAPPDTVTAAEKHEPVGKEVEAGPEAPEPAAEGAAVAPGAGPEVQVAAAPAVKEAASTAEVVASTSQAAAATAEAPAPEEEAAAGPTPADTTAVTAGAAAPAVEATTVEAAAAPAAEAAAPTPEAASIAAAAAPMAEEASAPTAGVAAPTAKALAAAAVEAAAPTAEAAAPGVEAEAPRGPAA